jgi:hypothetical protein
VISGQSYNSTALVNTTVNITNAAPLISSINLETPINLVAYSTKTVYCNVTAYDYDNNTNMVNATFYHSSVQPTSADNNNNHYSNTTCSRISPLSYYTNFTCGFDVSYFANNGTWYCNATVTDTLSVSTSNLSNSGTLNPLIAIKVPLLLDYGDVGVNRVSNDTLANITNAGNRNANISVEGYGATPQDGYAMICSSGSIALNLERYNITANSSYMDMTQLTGTTTMIRNYFVPQRTSPTDDSMNITYWKISIPIGAGGVCNGKILFTASDKGN